MIAHYGVICKGIKSASSFESSTQTVIDYTPTQNNACKVISGKQRKSIDRDKTPTSSSMQKRSGETEILEPSQSQATAATESYHHGLLQRLTVVIHKAERDSPSLVGAAGGDYTETSTKGNITMFRSSF
jgi:hypothetical protein